MLWFTGIGIYGTSGLSQKALDVIANCDIIYLERFTSLVSDKDIKDLMSLPSFGSKTISPVQRWFVEDGRQILAEAKNKDVILLSYGDPMVATTFSELRLRALQEGVKVSVVYGISGITTVISEIGLQLYKIGRIVTMMEEKQSTVSVYNTISNNLQCNCHTVILTEYRYNDDDSIFFLDPKEVILRLMQVEEDLAFRIFNDASFLIVASRIGTMEQKIVSGRAESLLNLDYGTGPHTIIFPASLHFIEKESIAKLSLNIDLPFDNTPPQDNVSMHMIKKYVPMLQDEITNIRNWDNSLIESKKTLLETLDNAECYIEDAINFLYQGKNELAILSIGYADGLVDCLNSMTKSRGKKETE
ncbi:MAG TPA: diphthine synthase [Nitrososphaeraceae archaeon]|jgi:diphthine synthase